MFLTNFSLKRPVFATVIILALLALGIIGYFKLNVNDWPDVEIPYVAVTIIEPGALPDHLENRVARPVEDAVGQIAGVKHITTRIQENAVTVIIEFKMDVDSDTAAQNVREKLGAIRADLPQDIKEPIVAQFNPTAAPVMTLLVTGQDLSERELSFWTDKTLRPRLETISGVGAVQMNGLKKREIQVLLDKERLASYGMTPAEVVMGLRSENLDVPAGSALSPSGQIALRSSGERKDLEALAGIPVGRRGTAPIFLRDVASIKDGLEESEELVYFQGRPAIGIDIIKQSGSNTVQVADDVHDVLDELQGQLPHGVKLEIVRDNSRNIRDSLADVQRTLFEGALLAILTVLLFLKDWRSTLISAIAIPTSIISTFWVMNLLHFTINTISLVALSLSVGLLIDDAIVVIENIYRHMRMGKGPLEAAREATTQIGLAVTATTLAVVAVFLPVGMMTGVAGQFFKEFGITVVVSVLVSLLVSFTLVPLLASRVLRSDEAGSPGFIGGLLDRFNHGFEWVTHSYVNALDGVLRQYRWQVLFGAFLLFGLSLLLLPLLPSSFITTGDAAELTIVAGMDSGVNLDTARKTAEEIEKISRAYPEVKKVYSVTDKDEARIFVRLTEKGDRDRDIFEIAQSLRQDMAKIPGAQTSILIKDFANLEQKNVEYRLLGEDKGELIKQAEDLQAIMKSIPGTVDVESSYKPGNPEQRLNIRSEAAADLGVSTGLIADTLRTMFTGTVVGQFQDGDNRYNIRVRLPEAQRSADTALWGIYLPAAAQSGAIPSFVSLGQVVEPVYSSTPGEIDRFDRSREIVLSCNLYGISPGEFNKAFLKKVEQDVELPEGYRLIGGGTSEAMEESQRILTFAVITAILFIFFVMAAQFESFIDPLAIMLSLPMAVIGAILGLFFTGSELSLISSIGFIMLMGLVTKNAILLIDFAKQERARGVDRHSAMLNAAATRLRPIVMTSTAMIFGMLPLALALGTGSETRSPMAHAIIGGLISSTLLTLFVVPILYTLLDDARNKFLLAGKDLFRSSNRHEAEIS